MKNKITKIISILMAVTMVATAFVGCSKKDKEKQEETTVTAEESTSATENSTDTSEAVEANGNAEDKENNNSSSNSNSSNNTGYISSAGGSSSSSSKKPSSGSGSSNKKPSGGSSSSSGSGSSSKPTQKPTQKPTKPATTKPQTTKPQSKYLSKAQKDWVVKTFFGAFSKYGAADDFTYREISSNNGLSDALYLNADNYKSEINGILSNKGIYAGFIEDLAKGTHSVSYHWDDSNGQSILRYNIDA